MQYIHNLFESYPDPLQFNCGVFQSVFTLDRILEEVHSMGKLSHIETEGE